MQKLKAKIKWKKEKIKNENITLLWLLLLLSLLLLFFFDCFSFFIFVSFTPRFVFISYSLGWSLTKFIHLHSKIINFFFVPYACFHLLPISFLFNVVVAIFVDSEHGHMILGDLYKTGKQADRQTDRLFTIKFYNQQILIMICVSVMLFANKYCYSPKPLPDNLRKWVVPCFRKCRR